jgi:hypothetical protein
MTQMPAGPSPFGTGTDMDDRDARDGDVSADVLPSAGHSSGLSSAIREELDAQFHAMDGDVDRMANDIRARIAEIDNSSVPEDSPDHTRLQADRALLVAQLSYVEDHLAVHGAEHSANASAYRETGSARVVGASGNVSTGSARRGRVRVYDR